MRDLALLPRLPPMGRSHLPPSNATSDAELALSRSTFSARRGCGECALTFAWPGALGAGFAADSSPIQDRRCRADGYLRFPKIHCRPGRRAMGQTRQRKTRDLRSIFQVAPSANAGATSACLCENGVWPHAGREGIWDQCGAGRACY